MSLKYPHKSFFPYLRLALWLLGSCMAGTSSAQQVFDMRDTVNLVPLGKQISLLDESATYREDTSVLRVSTFTPGSRNAIVFSKSDIDSWVRFTVVNLTGSAGIYLLLPTPGLPYMALYKHDHDSLQLLARAGTIFPFEERKGDDVNFIYSLKLAPGDTATYFLHVKSDHPLVLSLLLGTRSPIEHASSVNIFIIGAYCGILLVIFLYNLFVYFSVQDRSYFLYIIYVLFLGIAQLSSSGFAFKYMWPHSPSLNRYMIVLSSSITCIMATIFAYYFLQIKKYTPKVIWFVAYLVVTYLIAIICNFTGVNSVSYSFLDTNVFILGVIFIITSAVIARKGFRAAYFYLVAWSFLLLGAMVYVLKNYGVLPANIFTNYVLYIGSSIEAILLSNALADRINVLKKEKQESQAQALAISLENERLVRETNIDLEAKVHARTLELEDSNHSLNDTLVHLKATQSQLVEAEKMASLGVLTAGIAHEINNPINFVKSNIKPLTLDIQDLWELIQQYDRLDTGQDLAGQLSKINAYKHKIDIHFIRSEITSLLQGIEDGAVRTAEIVKGLRTFSRLDETELKKVNIFEGLDSTLVLLRSSMPLNVQVIRNFQTIPSVECFPGKMNQVFMNIMGNALYAMEKKGAGQPEFLTVSTGMYDPEHVEIRISDTGTGIPDAVKEKIFDPFFTTKDIGEGTGLGLSIVFNIIEKHNGKIIVHSTMGKGTEFQIILPIVHSTN